jgi:hypothetical protein
MLSLHHCPRPYDNNGSYAILQRFSMHYFYRRIYQITRSSERNSRATFIFHKFLGLLVYKENVYVVIFAYNIEDLHRHHIYNCWITNKILCLLLLYLNIFKLKLKENFLMPSV